MRVIAYAYDADVHCPHCAKLAYEAGRLSVDPGIDNVYEDAHGIPYKAQDSEGNYLGAIYSHAIEQEEYCGDCRGLIPETAGCGRYDE